MLNLDLAGNSLCVTRGLSQYLENSKIVSIAKIWNQQNLETTDDIVGLIFPLYYWGLPLIIKEFVTKIKLSKSSYIFAVVNAGGDVPGIPFMQLDQILQEKSKRLNASFFLSMPSNYIIGGSQETEEEQREKLLNVKGILSNFAEKIINKEDTPLIYTSEKKAKTIERMNTKFHNRVNESDNLFIVDENCTGCGVCETVCSLNNIVLRDSKPEWLHKCQQCLACINYCPENAIQYGTATLGKNRYHHPRINPEDLV